MALVSKINFAGIHPHTVSLWGALINQLQTLNPLWLVVVVMGKYLRTLVRERIIILVFISSATMFA